MAVLPAVERPLDLPSDPPEPGELLIAAGAEEVVEAEDAVDDCMTVWTFVVCGVFTDVTTTVTGSVFVWPLLVADWVTTEVMILVVGACEAAETVEV